MTGAKHTPGPWRAARDSDDFEDTGWIESSTGEPVTRYKGCGSHGCEVTKANLALLTAAPALADALADMLAQFRSPENYDEEVVFTQAREALRLAGRLP